MQRSYHWKYFSHLKPWTENALDWCEFTYKTLGLASYSQLATPEVSWRVCQLDCGRHLLRRLKFITQRLAPPLEDIQGVTKWKQFEKHWFRLLWKSPTEAQTPWLCSIILKKTLLVRRTELEPINDHSQLMEKKKKAGEKFCLLVGRLNAALLGLSIFAWVLL